MINSQQLYKAGREKKIFEVVDNLIINDFYNETGFKTSSVHGKMSRIKFVIVDVTVGKMDKAVVSTFNFKPSEFEMYIPLILDISKYNKYCTSKKVKCISVSKANPYTKYDGNLIKVTTMNISFESNLRIPKWKVEIITGKAAPNTDGFGFVTKTFKEISKSFFLLDKSEIFEMGTYVSKYIQLWESSVFPTYIQNRINFDNRCRNNSINDNGSIKINEATINTWNSNPNIKKNTNQNINSNSNSSENGNQICKCSNCNKSVDSKLAINTKKQFGKILCRECLAI